MPRTLRLADGSYMRRPDVQNLVRNLCTMQCAEVVGFSNVGKSALLRLLAQPDVWTQEIGEAGQEYLPVYIDCNRMLGLSAQGFYELVLRCLQESSETLAASPDLIAAYEALVAPTSDFQVPLSFNRGLDAALQATPRKVILLMDEFDEPFTHIDSRVFLNLRAVRDRHIARLAYVTAAGRPLTSLRVEEHCSEFCELFSPRTWYLAPLTRSDVDRLVRRYMDAYEAPFGEADLDFVYEWAGGHPTLLEGVCRVLDEALSSAAGDLSDSMVHWQLHRMVARQLRADENLGLECAKVWEECDAAEQRELLALTSADHQPDAHIVDGLIRRYILMKIEAKHQPFCRLFGEYVQRRRLHGRPDSAALWVDVESGAVLVGGVAAETLTNLEYRLMLLFFQNVEKIVDKYQIVTEVWGEGYIDEVDDARIEKLVSRLRQKIEPDPSSPRFLQTVRGRGYRLLLDGAP